MALAKFLDKAALAASQVLTSFDRTQFEEILLKQRIRIEFDKSATSSEGLATLDMAVRLLARLYPNLQFTYPSEVSETGLMLENLASAINPDINLSIENEPTVILAIGNTKIPSTYPTFYIGSNGWELSFSRLSPIGSGSTDNPFGAGIAACFGVANIFRLVFKDQLPTDNIDDEFSISLLTYKTVSKKLKQKNLKRINLGETTIVGLGAIGNSTVWALSKLPDLVGSLNLIDPEQLELSNLQRYSIALQSDIHRYKADIASELFSQPNLNVNPFNLSWGAFLEKRNNWNLELVAVGVDSANDRIEIQASLPKKIFNAWTQVGDMGVSRHLNFIDDCCLACLYIPTRAAKNRDELVSEAIGLPQELRNVRLHLDERIPLTEEFLRKIANAKGVPYEALAPYLNHQLTDFYSEAICGGTLLRISGNSDGNKVIEAPLAFQSAMAGIMLAAEIIIDVQNLRKVALPTMTRLDLLSRVSSYLSDSEPKHTSGKCLCQDKKFQNAFQQKWSKK